MSSIIQKSIYSLLEEEPFFAHFILNSNIVYDRFGVPTAGVNTINGVPTFVFNTKFLEKMTETQCKQIFKHEVLHLVLDHLTTFKALPKEDQVLANLATDCVINQYLTDLPEGCVTLSGCSEAVGYELAPFETSDYYYYHLKKKQEEVEKSGMTTLDDHDMECGDKGNEQVNKASVQAIAQKAVNQAAGQAPQAVIDTLAMSGEAVFPWKQILRNFIMKQVSNTTLNTQKRVNRRFAIPVPGKKKKRTMTLGVCLDSSGSVSDEAYISFLREVKSISRQVEKTYLVHADSVVQKVEELGSKTKISNTRAGCGGTAYQPAIDKCKELGCSVIIYFGDFDTSDTPVNPKVPFLWVGVGNQKPPADFGKVLRLPQ